VMRRQKSITNHGYLNRKMKRNDRLLKYWKDFSFKYKISVVNEKKLEEIFFLRISWLSGSLILFSLVVTIIVAVSSLIIATPIKNYLPGYLDVNARRDIVYNALRLDSLQQMSDQHERYLATVKMIVSGDLSPDSITSVDSLAQIDLSKLQASQAEQEFRSRYEEEELYNLNTLNKPKAADVVRFISPVNGLITKSYAKNERLGVTLQAETGLPVRAIADGTVVLAFEDLKKGSVIQVQHDNTWISTYSGVGKLVKTEGDRVSSGETIGLTEKTGAEKECQLYFQIWNKGKSVNPNEYITF
ncbi:MAG: murein hydrolase activator EnvC family protein, partial [Bacteroidales bacterium]